MLINTYQKVPKQPASLVLTQRAVDLLIKNRMFLEASFPLLNRILDCKAYHKKSIKIRKNGYLIF